MAVAVAVAIAVEVAPTVAVGERIILVEMGTVVGAGIGGPEVRAEVEGGWKWTNDCGVDEVRRLDEQVALGVVVFEVGNEGEEEDTVGRDTSGVL